MILGLSTATYTLVHVLISLVGIASGLIVLYGLLTANRMNGWTGLFLTSTVLTSVTGFGFPFHGVTPGIIVGIISLVLLALAILARYPLHLAGFWRPVYVICALMSLYLNVFVAVVQSFEKVPVLNAAAPTQKEPPFLVAQLVVLAIFVVLTILAVKRFHVEPVQAARAA